MALFMLQGYRLIIQEPRRKSLEWYGIIEKWCWTQATAQVLTEVLLI